MAMITDFFGKFDEYVLEGEIPAVTTDCYEHGMDKIRLTVSQQTNDAAIGHGTNSLSQLFQ